METYPHTVRGLRSALSVLGAIADEVAAALPAVGPVGCPLTAYLFAAFPAAVDVTINVDGHGTLARIYLDGDVVDTVLPPPVAAFIAAWDDGWYPQLRVSAVEGCGVAALPDTLEPPRIFLQLVSDLGGASSTKPDTDGALARLYLAAGK